MDAAEDVVHEVKCNDIALPTRVDAERAEALARTNDFIFYLWNAEENEGAADTDS